jgi:1-acyl-sn-glycerol-3-phosphate acyltransferase
MSLISYPGPLWRVWTLVAYVALFVTLMLHCTAIMMARLLPHRIRRPVQTFFIRGWCLEVFWFTGTRVVVEGAEHHDPNVPCLIISNHQSLLDIPAAYASLGGHIRMLAKKELFRLPMFGWTMASSEMIPIDRGNRSSGKAATEKLFGLVRSGIMPWIAPEGTRSHDGKIASFKKGAFVIAIESGVPLQPMVVLNAFDILPRSSLMVKPGRTLHVRVLPRIEAQGYSIDDRGALADKVREEMSRHLPLRDEASRPIARRRRPNVQMESV